MTIAAAAQLALALVLMLRLFPIMLLVLHAAPVTSQHQLEPRPCLLPGALPGTIHPLTLAQAPMPPMPPMPHADVALSGMPFVSYHFLALLLYGSTYLAFMWIYYGTGSCCAIRAACLAWAVPQMAASRAWVHGSRSPASVIMHARPSPYLTAPAATLLVSQAPAASGPTPFWTGARAAAVSGHAPGDLLPCRSCLGAVSTLPSPLSPRPLPFPCVQCCTICCCPSCWPRGSSRMLAWPA